MWSSVDRKENYSYMLFLPRMPFLNHQSSKPESSSCSPESDLFQRSPFAFVSGHSFWELQKQQPQDFPLRQATSTLYCCVFSLPWHRGRPPWHFSSFFPSCIDYCLVGNWLRCPRNFPRSSNNSVRSKSAWEEGPHFCGLCSNRWLDNGSHGFGILLLL